MTRKYISPKEAAARLGVCEKTIYRWIRTGKIRWRRWDRCYFIPVDNTEQEGGSTEPAGKQG